MRLEPSYRQAIKAYVPSFQRYLQSPDGQRDQRERAERVELYRQLLSPDNLRAISEPELVQVIGSLWASAMWGNKAYLVDRIIQSNGLEKLREALGDLLWGKAPLPDRFDAFARRVKGLGPASVTELLAFVHPEECGLWNDKARKALAILGLDAIFPKIRSYYLSGAEYLAFNELLGAVRDEVRGQGLDKLDLLGVDFFLFHVWETQGRPLQVPPSPEPDDYDFDHDEMVDKLVSIGQWMGFEAEKGKWIAKGAKVDVVWQARIANLGIVTYVFEVQRSGSIDSLILNLQKARRNPSVQKVVVVANTKSVREVQEEVAALSQDFAGAVAYMEARDLAQAAEHLQAFSEIIGRLGLVPGYR